MKMQSIFLSLILLLGVASAQQSSTRRNVQQILATTVPDYKVSAINLLQAAAQVASDFDLPIGIEWEGDSAAKREIDHEWQNTKLEKIVYDLATFDVEYQVEVSNGVVHLRKANLADSLRNPLNLKIPEFSVANTYTGLAGFKLRDHVNLILFPRQQEKLISWAGSYGAGDGEVRVTFDMTNPSVRDILDRLLADSGHVMWLVVFRSQQQKTGFLMTQSPLRNTSDLQQPDWDFVTRYNDPATGRYRGDWKIGLRR